MYRSASNFKVRPVRHFGLALIAVLALAVVLAGSMAYAQAPGQKTFGTPDEAVQALMTAAQAGDTTEMLAIFGPDGKELVTSGDEASDKRERERALKAYKELARLAAEEDGKVFLHLGKDDWPFPIPLMEKDGAWYFDTAAGKEELINRRIGRNELRTIETCKAYVDAQREYASKDLDNDQVLEFAQRIRSTPDHCDGLFWPTVEGRDKSPMGISFANAALDESGPGKLADPTAPYHGYYFKVLKAQGPAAPGGAYNYVINGNMIAGFAAVAYPSDYGVTGIMTFIVNQQGTVYQQDLGRKTEEIASRMTKFEPDKNWKKVEQEE